MALQVATPARGPERRALSCLAQGRSDSDSRALIEDAYFYFPTGSKSFSPSACCGQRWGQSPCKIHAGPQFVTTWPLLSKMSGICLPGASGVCVVCVCVCVCMCACACVRVCVYVNGGNTRLEALLDDFLRRLYEAGHEGCYSR